MVAVRIALLVVAVVVASLACPHAPRPASPTAPLVAPSADYVGSAACRKCHPAEHATWHGSFHRTMSQPAARANLLASFDRLDLDWWGKPVLLEWRGDTLWTKFERGGRRPAAVERPVEQLTGSHHLQVLWYSTGAGRELAPVPLCFKAEERVWLPLSAVFVLPPEFRDPPEPGAWSQSCSGCHATDVRPRIDIGRNDTHVGELGVGCESCHGPGGKHVAANQEPVRRYRARAAGADATVRNPDTLSPVRSAQACGQCHSVSILRQRHHESWREDGSPFRPGMDLHATHLVVGAQDTEAPELRRELAANPDFFASAFWSDGQVRLSGREFSGLRQSPCYTHGDAARQMDCTSCHEMHPDDGRASPAWRRGQMRDGMAGDAACTQCHAQFAAPAALQAHTRHAPSSAGSRCYDCHMPHTSVGLMKASRSHQVTSPDVAVELATGRPNACNLCHLDRTLQWTAEQLQAGWGVAPPALDDDQRTVAAGARWLLTGDAGLRLLAAWSFGWAPARATAGEGWMAPYLGRVLDDPYYVVRFAAARSLRSIGHGDALADFDFLADPAVARPFGEAVARRWAQDWRGAANPALLLGDRGLDEAAFARLYARRDDRKVYIAE
jgi:hypothetical protein